MEINMNWKLIDKRSEYYIWAAPVGMGKYMYQCTKVNTPPDTDSGYYSLSAMLQRKGLY